MTNRGEGVEARVCVFRKALRHKYQGHLKDTTWTSADDDGDPAAVGVEGRAPLCVSHCAARARFRLSDSRCLPALCP